VSDISSGLNKGLGTVEVRLKWDPSPMGEPDHDLDLVAAVYEGDGAPAYVVHFDSRSPEGTITLNRDSRTGQGFGADEVLELELERVASPYTRIVVGVVIQQAEGHKTFGQVESAEARVFEGYDELAVHDLRALPHDTAATVAEFVRDEGAGGWEFHPLLRGFDVEPEAYAGLMGKS
jgi:tellurium resistance protein TerD